MTESAPKSPKSTSDVIPAKAGIQSKHTLLDPGFCRGDDFWTFRSGLMTGISKIEKCSLSVTHQILLE